MAADQKINHLAREAQHGNLEAFRGLVGKVTPLLRAYFRRKGARDLEDLIQDTWVRVVGKLGQYDADRNFRRWIFGIAYHRWVDTLRGPHLRLLYGLIVEPANGVDGNDCGEMSEELIARLERCMSRLTEEQRTIIRLRYWDQLQLDAVARHMRKPYGSIKGKAYHAVEKLRKCMRAKGLGNT